jgi:hypothetical protein
MVAGPLAGGGGGGVDGLAARRPPVDRDVCGDSSVRTRCFRLLRLTRAATPLPCSRVVGAMIDAAAAAEARADGTRGPTAPA